MAEGDRTHWDEKYSGADAPEAPAIPDRFQDFAKHFAGATKALEVACGAGRFSVWLAQQGVQVTGYDISPVAVAQANALADSHRVSDRCSFGTADFDGGLPPGDQVDLVVCNMFRDPTLDDSLVGRLGPTGTLAIAALSEVGAQPGRFRVSPGALTLAFAHLNIRASNEADGVAWLVASKR